MKRLLILLLVVLSFIFVGCRVVPADTDEVGVDVLESGQDAIDASVAIEEEMVALQGFHLFEMGEPRIVASPAYFVPYYLYGDVHAPFFYEFVCSDGEVMHHIGAIFWQNEEIFVAEFADSFLEEGGQNCVIISDLKVNILLSFDDLISQYTAVLYDNHTINIVETSYTEYGYEISFIEDCGVTILPVSETFLWGVSNVSTCPDLEVYISDDELVGVFHYGDSESVISFIE